MIQRGCAGAGLVSRAHSRAWPASADLDASAWVARHPMAPLCSAYAQVPNRIGLAGMLSSLHISPASLPHVCAVLSSILYTYLADTQGSVARRGCRSWAPSRSSPAATGGKGTPSTSFGSHPMPLIRQTWMGALGCPQLRMQALTALRPLTPAAAAAVQRSSAPWPAQERLAPTQQECRVEWQ